jgi:hypothetical protein
MLVLPMNMPVEIHRVAHVCGGDTRVACGPLVIMAHGLRSIEAGRRRNFIIRSPLGEIDADQAEEALRNWSVPALRRD